MPACKICNKQTKNLLVCKECLKNNLIGSININNSFMYNFGVTFTEETSIKELDEMILRFCRTGIKEYRKNECLNGGSKCVI